VSYTDLCRFILSPPFTFLVGEEKESVVVSSAAMAALSRPFDRLINGSMKEAQERQAELPDVNKDDFIRLCEYAYYHDYTLPPFELAAPDQDIGAESTEMKDGNNEPGPASSSKNHQDHFDEDERLERESTEQRMVTDRGRDNLSIGLEFRHKSRIYLAGGRHPHWIYAFCPLWSTLETGFTTAPVLLAHAKLYALAGRFLIPILKGLTLEKLRNDLSEGTPYLSSKGRAADVLELACFAYSDDNIADRGEDGKLDELRQLITEYLVLNIDWVGKDASFEELLHESGEFAVDFWRIHRREQECQKEGLTRSWAPHSGFR
jgi:hypothetical protein